MRLVLLCVRDFARDPVFIQCRFFSETGVAMLSEAAAFSDSVTSSPVYAPWLEVENNSSAQVMQI